MNEPRVAVVVVAFGHAVQLPATLESIARQDYPADRLRIVVVDNGGGKSAAVARASVPGALVLEPEHNLGFAGGCNLGVARGAADVVVLVNPDVELRAGFVRALVRALDDTTVGVVGAKLLYPDGARLQHAGGTLDLPLGLTAHRGYDEPDSSEYAEAADLTYVTGAALAARRDLWDKLGGMDENFGPAYFEEVDFCLRVHTAGYRVRYIPEAIATHGEASALGRTSVPYYRLYHANRLRLLFKHHDDPWLAAEWLPAELRHLRTVADDNEIDGLLWSYRTWQAHFVAGGAATTARIDGWQGQPAETAAAGSELAWTLRQVEQKRTIAPVPFQSRIPGLARLRGWIVGLGSEEYLRPILQQQNDFNASVAELAVALERQRRTVDGATLCQGVLLAKVIGELQRPLPATNTTRINE